MTPCERIQRWLAQYVEADLGRRRRALVEDHLAGCPACRAELAALRQVERLLVQACPVSQAAPDLWQRTSASLDTRPAPHRTAWRPLVLAAAATAVLLLGVFTLRRVSAPTASGVLATQPEPNYVAEHYRIAAAASFGNPAVADVVGALPSAGEVRP